MAVDALIFDFDGVIADSEIVANLVLAETVSALGLPTTVDEALDRYMGRRWPELVALIAAGLGRDLPQGFGDDLKAATLARFRTDLREVAGAGAFIRGWGRGCGTKRAIASSSSADRLALCLELLGLADAFGPHVFSADLVPRGKPHPDIYLHAADRLGVAPERCVVIEDSPSGVRAGVAAGMIVIGFCGGAHIRPGHAERLAEAGAVRIARRWAEMPALFAAL
jgi:beta-phosphoglucomutase-like phosphatase (HAD superfamily)